MATTKRTKTKAANVMRRIALTDLSCENFKGLKRYHAIFDGNNAVVKAANGVGKTTLYDLFLWVVFGKDSTGRKDFGVRPIETDPDSPNYGEAIKGLVLAGQVGLRIDGENHVLRKEHHEKVTKGQLRGYETLCWIDEVPKKVGEYQAAIEAIMPEDAFKTLTDLAFFTTKMHWTDRRTVLLEVAGEAGTPAGFDALLAVLNGRTLEEYEKVLRDRKKLYAKERDEINPRIDELNRNLTEGGDDKPELTQRRKLINGTLAEIETERKTLVDAEADRQQIIDHVHALLMQQARREAELKSDTSALRELLDEKAKLVTEQAGRKRELAEIGGEVAQAKVQVGAAKNELSQLQLTRTSLQDEYTTASEKPLNATCYACGQKLPAAKVKEIEAKRQAELTDIIKRGNAIQITIGARQADLLDLLDAQKKLCEREAEFAAEVKAAEAAKNARITKIDKAIENKPKADPKKDKKWQEIASEIKRAEAVIGESVSDQLQALEERRAAAMADIEDLTKALAQVDRAKEDKARIEELANREKELAQLVADTEKELAEIDRYTVAQSELIEANVNDLFRYVEFKMFDVQLNEGIRETCEATYYGVPFADLSTGQQILCGVDIVNVLSKHYGFTAPLFIDHTESITLPIEAVAQTIRLCAVAGVKTLQVQVQQREKVVA